ncbi:MAG TPA: hypothetical protein VJV78_02975 [Polyangiales bacterium]|nr:hypothetical protein [Polyangiales bacterium]
MKDPDTDAGFTPTEFERRLLDSARADSIPPALKQSMHRALHASLGGGAAGAAAATSIWTSKTGLVVLISAAALGSFASYRLIDRPATPPAPTTTVASPATAPAAAPSLQALQPTAAEPQQLTEEIALLDRARGALQARAPERALDLLEEHSQRFARPSLGPEAEVLRIEALVQNRELPRARALAKSFLNAHPSSPLAERVSKLAR